MKSTDLLRNRTLANRSLVGFAAACGFTLMMNGVALAAENNQDNTAQIVVVTGNEAAVEVNQDSTHQVSGATEVKPSGTSSSSEQVLTSSGSAGVPVSQSQTSLTPGTMTSATEPKVTQPAPAASMDGATATSQASKAVATVSSAGPEVHTQLTPTSSGWIMVPTRGGVAPVAHTEIAHAIAAAAAALPPVNTPVIPQGLFGQWFLGLAGGALPTTISAIIAPYYGLEFTILLLVLTVFLLKVAGMTYGAWLRRVGHVTAARSDLTSLFFATPLLMDFIRVSPPERGPFLGVSNTNRHIINYPQKGAML